MRQMIQRTDIPIGRANAKSKHDFGLPEREVRRQIAQLRAEPGEDGYAILSSSHSPSGFWRSNDPEEIREFVRETEHRARATFVAISGAKHILRQLETAQAYPRRLDQRGEA